MTFKIYKVRILDPLGVEVAECGFYLDREDAEKRRAEVARTIRDHSKNLLDIREITVNGSIPCIKPEVKDKHENKDHYDFK